MASPDGNFYILRAAEDSGRPALPRPRTVSVTELQDVIRTTLPAGSAKAPPPAPRNLAVQDVVGVGAGPTGMNLWSLVREPGVTLNAFDEVFPRILLGNRELAEKPAQLELFNVTHVLNAAEGKKFNQVNTSAETYTECNSGAGLVYCGVPALDVMNYPLYKHFTRAAEFIQQALDSGGRAAFSHVVVVLPDAELPSHR